MCKMTDGALVCLVPLHLYPDFGCLLCAGRYRIQGSSLEALGLLSSELVRRLTAHFRVVEESKKPSEPLAFGFTENVPLHDLFTAIDQHFEVSASINRYFKPV